MNKFEQLIEYVINDEEAKARELFHELVVEKSRNIYEEMMSDEEMVSDEDEIDEGMGGDQADDLIGDIETEEEGISMEGDDMDGAIELDGEEESEEDSEEGLEDRVVDLEDKLDELMAEFEGLMGGDVDATDDMDMDAEDMGMDMEMDMDAEEIEDDEFETEGMRMSMEEAISLKAAPKPVTSEEGSINKKSAVAANSGARGAVAKPVHATGTEAQGRTAPGTKELIGKVGNTPSQSTQKPTPATKPHLAQATGVNTKSVIK
jgi:hypothetical protein